jgi:Flp pilus assembly protein TadD
VAGRPLANLTFALNYTFGGLDVVGYHMVNIGNNARRDLINLLLVKGQMVETERECRDLLVLHPDDAEGHNCLGVALASQGRTDEALDQFRAAVRLDPSAPQARDNLAQAVKSKR